MPPYLFPGDDYVSGDYTAQQRLDGASGFQAILVVGDDDTDAGFTIDVKFQAFDPITGLVVDIPLAVFAQKSAAGSSAMLLHPGSLAAANQVVNFIAPRILQALAVVDAQKNEVQLVTISAGSTTDEVQHVDITGVPTGGTFTLTFDDTGANPQETAGIPYNANAAAVKTALTDLSNIGVNDITVTGTNPNFVVSFIGVFLDTDVLQLVADPALLTRNSIDVTTTVEGVLATTDEVQTVDIIGAPTGGTFTLTFDDSGINPQTTGPIAFDANAAAVQAALIALSNIPPGGVVVSGSNPNFTVTFAGALGLADQLEMTGSGALLTPIPDVDLSTTIAGGTPDTFTLTFEGDTTDPIDWNADAADVELALEALASIGNGNVTVTNDGGPWTVEFIGDLADLDLEPMTGDGVGCTVAVTTVQDGAGVVTFTLNVIPLGG